MLYLFLANPKDNQNVNYLAGKITTVDPDMVMYTSSQAQDRERLRAFVLTVLQLSDLAAEDKRKYLYLAKNLIFFASPNEEAVTQLDAALLFEVKNLDLLPIIDEDQMVGWGFIV